MLSFDSLCAAAKNGLCRLMLTARDRERLSLIGRRRL
jgi:hypothetical protein